MVQGSQGVEQTDKASPVVYFDQQTGVLHIVCWLKSFYLALKQVFPSFSVTNRKKKEKRKESAINNAPKHWQTPFL